MRIFLLVVALILQFYSCFSQQFTFKDLQKMATYGSVDSVDSYLRKKGFFFSETGNDSDNRTKEVGKYWLFKPSIDKIAETVWLVKTDKDSIDITYDLKDKRVFYALKDAFLKVQNTKLVAEESITGENEHYYFIRTYRDPVYTYEFCIYSGEPDVVYTITVKKYK